MSEQEVLSKIRSLPSVATSTQTASAKIKGYEMAEGVAERDLLREAAYARGIDVSEIQPCYYSRVAYDWCLALLGITTSRPPHPFPLELNELLLKLLGTGRVEASQIRQLGLEWLLAEVVSGRVESTLRNIIMRVMTPAEAETSLMRLSQLVRAASRVVEPTLLERKIAEIARRVAGSEEVTRAFVSFIRGELSPTRAVEEIVSATSPRRSVAPAQETERKEVARAVAPRGEGEIETARKALVRGE